MFNNTYTGLTFFNGNITHIPTYMSLTIYNVIIFHACLNVVILYFAEMYVTHFCCSLSFSLSVILPFCSLQKYFIYLHSYLHIVYFQITILLATVIALGACAKLIRSEGTWIAFNIGQSLQGILVAMLVTCNCQVLKIYTRTIKSKGSRIITTYGNTSADCRPTTDLSRSTSLQLLTWEPAPDPV